MLADEIKKLVDHGYGYYQMLNKLGITHDDVVNICDKLPSFKHQLEKKYKIDFNTKIVKVSDVSDGTQKSRRKSKRNTE